MICSGCHTENDFHDLDILELIFEVLPRRKWILGIYQTENGFYEVATQKTVFNCLGHGKWFHELALIREMVFTVLSQRKQI